MAELISTSISSIPATISVRSGLSTVWKTKNPILAKGEPGYETDTKKLKIGDGINHYNDLNYISGTGGGETIVDPISLDYVPQQPLHAVNKQYVDGFSRRMIVQQLPEVQNAIENVIYMIKITNVEGNNNYRDYMLINGIFECIGDVTPDLDNVVAKSLQHTLTFGANQNYTFDGSKDLTVPVYTGTAI